MSRITLNSFQKTYSAFLDDPELTFIRKSCTWFPIPGIADLPADLLLSIAKGHLVAHDYLLQPPTLEAPRYLPAWEIISKLLAVQPGGGGKEVCMALAPGYDNLLDSDDEEAGQARDGGGFDSEEWDGWYGDGHRTAHAYEAPLAGEYAGGRAEFVLLRTLTEVTLPLLHGLELVSQPKGAIPVLVGEVKTAAAFDQHIWQPLAGALELMNRSAAPPDSMWVFLTDIEQWHFVRVDRVSGGGAAAGTGDTAAGAAAAGPRYRFTRYDSVSISIAKASGGYLQLLAILHHIIFPKQQLADLPGRIAKSRMVLETRAKKWVKESQAEAQTLMDKQQLAAAKVKAEAEAARLGAELEAAKEREARLVEELAEARAALAKVQQAAQGQGG